MPGGVIYPRHDQADLYGMYDTVSVSYHDLAGKKCEPKKYFYTSYEEKQHLLWKCTV